MTQAQDRKTKIKHKYDGFCLVNTEVWSACKFKEVIIYLISNHCPPLNSIVFCYNSLRFLLHFILCNNHVIDVITYDHKALSLAHGWHSVSTK